MRNRVIVRRTLVVAALFAAACAKRGGTVDTAGAAVSTPDAPGGAAVAPMPTSVPDSAVAVPMPAASVKPAALAGAPTAPAATESRALIDSLERAARALAHTDGCRSAAECRVAPLGAKACGGPRDYVAYCTRSTDTLALFRALARLEAAEKRFNTRSGMISTCEMRLAPTPTLVAGRCGPASAAPPTAGAGGAPKSAVP